MAIGKLPDGDIEDDDGAIFADINITPLTDLFLVMLIIFMVTASVAVEKATKDKKKVESQAETQKRAGLKVNLPSGAAQEIDPTSSSLIVAISANGDMTVNDERIKEEQLDLVFRNAFARDKNTQVILKADTGVNHGRVVGVMERAKQVGLTRLAIATRSSGN